MNKFASCAAARLSPASLLAGCATDDGRRPSTGASVTRFHLGQPIARGQIAVEPADPRRREQPRIRARSRPRSSASSTRLGWTVDARQWPLRAGRRGPASTRQRASGRRGARPQHRRSASAAAAAGRGGGVGVGVGGTVPVAGGAPTRSSRPSSSVRIQRRSDATVAWEGRAETEARGGTRRWPAAPAAADRLAAALFRDFPGESGRTIRVR